MSREGRCSTCGHRRGYHYQGVTECAFVDDEQDTCCCQRFVPAGRDLMQELKRSLRPAAPVVQGADELRDDAWWTRVFLAVEELVDSVPYADGSKWPVPHAAAFRAAVEPELARLLAERDQAQAKVARVRGEVDAWADAASDWYFEHRHDDAGTTYACGFEDGWNHAEERICRALDDSPRTAAEPRGHSQCLTDTLDGAEPDWPVSENAMRWSPPRPDVEEKSE